MKDSSPRCETGWPERAALFRAGKTAEKMEIYTVIGDYSADLYFIISLWVL